MGKSKKKQIKIRGTKLTVWCPGWETFPTKMQPWYIVTAPFYVNDKGHETAYAPRWDDGHTTNALPDGLCFDDADNARTHLESIREHNPESMTTWYTQQK